MGLMCYSSGPLQLQNFLLILQAGNPQDTYWTSIKGQIPQKAVEEIQSLFENGVDIKKTPEEKKLEEKFKPENFDLITWFVVSG